MIEYKLITLPFITKSDSFEKITHEIENTIEQEKKGGWQFVKMTPHSNKTTRLKHCYDLIFRKNKN